MNRALMVITLALVAMASAVLAGNWLAHRVLEATPGIPETAGYACVSGEVSHSARSPSLYSDARPPARFQGDIDYRVRFVAPDQITAVCMSYGDPAPPCGMRWKACTNLPSKRIIAPNPCAFPDQSYAATLCHELGHANGWSAAHGE